MLKYLTALLLLTNTCFAQTILKGSLPSLPNTSFSIVVNQSALNNYAGVQLGQGETGDNGQFSSLLDITTEQQVNVFIGNAFFVIWIKPNTTLYIKEENNSYTFSGAAAKENEVLYTSGLMQPYKISANVTLDSFVPAKQLRYLDSIETTRLLLVKEKGETSLSNRFLSYYKAEVTSFSYFNKNQYPGLCKAMNKITDKDIPLDYFKFWDGFTLQDDSTTSVTYANAVQDFIEFKTLAKIGRSQIGTEQAWVEMFKTADTLLQQRPFSLQRQKTAYLLLLIKYFNLTAFTAEAISNYEKQFPSSASLPIINNAWQKKQGSALVRPSFRLKNNASNWVDIKDLEGKVVYVDFWGSWCKACIINMPHAGQLKEKLKGKDVVFLYLNFYDTEEQWHTAIKKYAIEGTHLKAEKTDEEYFDKVFNISQGFPRYALIDKKGSLVTISAPPPKDPAAYDLIIKYLEK